ncbi:putative 40S ribosomal protein S18 [Monocercomonoides exilis]|uniref:putative 40S ribosomal protein S18 n=1 Tax=Monocercomonoides exilis TaxID=2049356 RepID=UPI00355A2B22|nr:putative 40S ribosomal protein S18 [Monocercomonoides exilis]KAH7827242.1 putative 40S ribosomal protein S18 [Monocercomonoides exilis]KAH7827284.1 putative 40S ribosomal protein S18 [Monocercomonoides exilis]|eukprot:MONOS_626.1-p1 / transcript=MONOS_626.1 / gene=MONOS_626 / organism=Monocercomonoides_exilis_PA203 / gene_product=40S ribosomal protein S18 / transcript_product=40S ribosomal protein S18 / location=Mono_scaffold00010:75443-76182(-) / protein_length=155 / sequence_SO=supercontig / SO=protein_coding / is_pseudo=false
MTLVAPENFQHILRVFNTNINGTENVVYALTAIKGIGRRFSTLVCKRANVDTTKRAGQLTQSEIDRLIKVIENPLDHKIPEYFLNHRRDIKDGTSSHATSQQVDIHIRDAIERLKKIRAHRGLRHMRGIRVRGQHTKTTGRHGHTIGVSKKKTA